MVLREGYIKRKLLFPRKQTQTFLPKYSKRVEWGYEYSTQNTLANTK
ncbi:MAG: hypothetical protein QG628_933 [Patescibacteria group bacterium]|jgi:hypothetical protein|nr:hypothetical protein [Patescibacteria group bacterium]